MTPKEKINELINDEFEEMCAKYGADFASLHEAYAVTLEKTEEAAEEMDLLTGRMKDLWDAVRYNYVGEMKKQFVKCINKHALKCTQECIQVSACCNKMLRLLDREHE